jgi:hypothetical protein
MCVDLIIVYYLQKIINSSVWVWLVVGCFLKKFNLFWLEINLNFMFLEHFDILILKINFKK